jgi:hypothetical protein
MPKITYIKEIDGEVWARLFMDFAIADGPLHIFTEKELRELRNNERKAVERELERTFNKWEE